jgi:single-strand DNA-binding protein
MTARFSQTAIFCMALCSIFLVFTEAFNQPQYSFLRRIQGLGALSRCKIQKFSSPNRNFNLGLSVDDDDDDDDDDRLSDEELSNTMQEWDNRIARFNTVHVTGRIGSDPEAKYFDDGKVVVNVSLASKRKYVGPERKALGIQSGDEETDWYALEIWGQVAEFVAKYVEKGSRVGVVGSLQVDEWKDKETGEPRCRPKVIVRDFDVLESKAEADLRRSTSNRGSDDFFERSAAKFKAASQFFD